MTDFDPTLEADWPANDPAKRTNTPFPGASGGMIETVKRAVIGALRESLTGTTLNGLVNASKITVDMEYPMVPEKYPGIWVQFSFSQIQNSGVGMELLYKHILTEAVVDAFGEVTTPEAVVWEPIREFYFKGRCTLTVVALTSLERDRIADGVIAMLAFSRPPEYVITKASEDTKQFRQLIQSLANNPYIAMTLNHDTLLPGGQAMTTGVPWQADLPSYEDSYSFDLEGQANIRFAHDGTYTLHAITDLPEMIVPAPTRFQWQ
jgi:hypothetical protein